MFVQTATAYPINRISSDEGIEIGYWNKHYELDVLMRDIFYKKYTGRKPIDDDLFEERGVTLTLEDIQQLRICIQKPSFYDNDNSHHRIEDFKFLEIAQLKLQNNHTVFYHGL